jgi:hypothetical protein
MSQIDMALIDTDFSFLDEIHDVASWGGFDNLWNHENHIISDPEGLLLVSSFNQLPGQLDNSPIPAGNIGSDTASLLTAGRASHPQPLTLAQTTQVTFPEDQCMTVPPSSAIPAVRLRRRYWI